MMQNRKTINIVLTAILLFLFSACSATVRYTNENNVKTSQTHWENTDTTNIVAVFTGVASYYADKYHGRKTANGEIYDMYGLTAAHPDWPFETIARIINLRNSKSAIIRINDRMPFRPDRIIDVSLGCAKSLGMVNDGIVEVRIEILRWGQ